ncbi:MAG: phospho-N-acetylmuramoyl-pentapeptide-transferase [Planctomycetota bacterium]
MFYFLHYLHEADSWRLVLNLFRYVTFRAAAGAATGFLIAVFLLPWLIRRLKAMNVLERAENPDSADLAKLQAHKGTTPTMGGVAILAGVLGATALWCDLSNLYVQLAAATGLLMGLIGFADDWMKLKGLGRDGMTARRKLVLQFLAVAGLAGVFVIAAGGPFDATRLALPFVKPGIFAPRLGAFYVLFATLLIVGSSNAVNLTDGLDGLASGCAAVAALAYAVLAYVAGHVQIAGYLNLPFIRGAEEMTIICAALAGATLGFLWFNSHPAEIFMGDTGSLAIGGILGMAACVAKQELLLALVGGVFVLEAGSVILQVGSFKLTGRRIFRIAPLHHHFQFRGWSEDKVVVRFWIMAVIFALMSVATLKVR